MNKICQLSFFCRRIHISFDELLILFVRHKSLDKLLSFMELTNSVDHLKTKKNPPLNLPVAGYAAYSPEPRALPHKQEES